MKLAVRNENPPTATPSPSRPDRRCRPFNAESKRFPGKKQVGNSGQWCAAPVLARNPRGITRKSAATRNCSQIQ